MYRDDKFNKIPVPEDLDKIIDASIEKGIQMQKKNRKKKVIGICTGMAAAAAVFSVVCISFPAAAAKIPFIGRVFSQVEEQVSYKGDYSAVAQTLVSEEETLQSEEVKETNPYVQKQDGISVTISEVYYNSQALYLAMSIENEEGFPEDFIKTKNMEDYILDYDMLSIEGKHAFSFIDNDDDFLFGQLEGRFEDSDTFIGIYRVDLSHLEQEIPEKFQYNMQLTKLYGYLFETEEEIMTDPDGEEITFYDPIRKEYEGNWAFNLDVEVDNSRTQIAEINDTNEEGVGISQVIRTPYEITAKEIIPDSEKAYDYFLVICDADGDLMDFQGDFTNTYQVYGRNTDTVYVYICDYIEYMDEIKGYYWSEDYEEKKKTKNFKEYLDERALFGTEVTF